MPTMKVHLIKSCGLSSSTGWKKIVQPVDQDQWPILMTSTGWPRVVVYFTGFNRLKKYVQLVGKEQWPNKFVSTGWRKIVLPVELQQRLKPPLLDLLSSSLNQSNLENAEF